MPEKDIQTAGSQANANFAANMKARDEAEELGWASLINEACLDCSAAWSHASRGTAEDRLGACLGRAQIKVGGTALMACHLQNAKEA